MAVARHRGTLLARLRDRGTPNGSRRKPVEFIVTVGPGGGTDNFARIDPVDHHQAQADRRSRSSSLNKGGGSGAEGFVYGKAAVGDPHKRDVRHEQRVPVAADREARMEGRRLDARRRAWRSTNSSCGSTAKRRLQRRQGLHRAVKAKPDTFKMGGSQSKDTDQTLTSDNHRRHGREIPLRAVQERRRSGGAAGRWSYRLEHQQSEREHRPVEGRSGDAAVRVQPEAARTRGRRSRRRWGGPTFRRARNRASRSISTSSRGRCGCRRTSRPTRWRSTSMCSAKSGRHPNGRSTSSARRRPIAC